MFTVSFNTNGHAFNDGHGAQEISRILQGLASKVESLYMEGTIVDVNGNTIGTWSWKHGE